MSDRKFNFVFTFTVICALSAFIGWCGGYDFDQRNSGVALWVFTTIFAATFVGSLVAEMTREDEIWKM